MFRVKRTIVFLVFAISPWLSSAQCAMCKAIAESNNQGGGSVAEGLNDGIIFLMFIPYILIGLVAYGFYRQRKVKA